MNLRVSLEKILLDELLNLVEHYVTKDGNPLALLGHRMLRQKVDSDISPVTDINSVAKKNGEVAA